MSVFNFLFVSPPIRVCLRVILLKRHFLSHLSIEIKPKHFCLHESCYIYIRGCSIYRLPIRFYLPSVVLLAALLSSLSDKSRPSEQCVALQRQRRGIYFYAGCQHQNATEMHDTSAEARPAGRSPHVIP